MMADSKPTKTALILVAVCLLLVLALVAVLGAYSNTTQTDEMVVDWKYSTNSSYISGSLAATQERVYFVGGSQTDEIDEFEDGNVSVYSLNASSGEEVWRFKIGSFENISLRDKLTLHNGTVYASGVDGRFYAIDPDSGTEEWNMSVNGMGVPFSTVSNGVAYVGGGAGIRALDATTGRLLWNSSIDGRVRSVTASEDTVYLGGEEDEGLLIALNASSGERIWSYKTPGPGSFALSPSVGDGFVYVMNNFPVSSSTVYAIDTRTGKQKWEFSLSNIQEDDRVDGSVGVSDGMVYSPGGYVYALDGITGETRWKYNVSGVVAPHYTNYGRVYRQSMIQTTPVVEGGSVYVGVNSDAGSEPPHVFALDTESGESEWSVTSGKTIPPGQSPAVEDDRLYVGTHFNMNGTVYALNLTALRESDRISHTIDGGYGKEETGGRSGS